MKALLIEPELSQSLTAERIIDKFGYTVVTVRSAKVGLEHLVEMNYDLCVLSLSFPEIEREHFSGVDLIESYRGPTPLITLSFYSDDYGKVNLKAHLRRLGVKECLDKPVTEGALIAAITAILSSGA